MMIMPRRTVVLDELTIEISPCTAAKRMADLRVAAACMNRLRGILFNCRNWAVNEL